ncbi:MAG: hypothetical protein KAT46_04570 [Deltaproteobacteria bacterium]|nr:hypothetical protein [Deltaproteobacteria bacterium]
MQRRIIKNFIFLISILFLTLPVLSYGEPTAEDLELYVAKALLKGQWSKVENGVVKLVKIDSDFAELYSAVRAYAALKAGKKTDALRYIEGRDDLASLLMSASIYGGKSVKGLNKEFKKATPYVFKVKKRRSNGLSLGLFPKSAEAIALKKSFYNLVSEPTKEQIRIFSSEVLTDKGAYFLGGEIVWEGDKSMVCIAFVDTLALAEALYITGDETTVAEVATNSDSSTATKEKVTVGVLTRQGKDANRLALLKKLRRWGFDTEDLGRGDFYSLGDKAKLAGVVVEIQEEVSVEATALSEDFKNINTTLVLNIFNSVSGKSVKSITKESSTVQMDLKKAKSNGVRALYKKTNTKLKSTLTALEKTVKWSAGGLPPMQVSVTSDEVFSSNYKYYAINPFGKVTFSNNTQKPFGSLKLEFLIKDYVDFPTEINIGKLPAGTTLEKDLTVIFNDRIVDLTDDTHLQSEIKVTYYELGKKKTVTTTHPIYVYERHALVWDDKGKIASFITPKDPVIVKFADMATRGYKSKKLPKNIVKARAVFGALGVLGLNYMEDPNNPYGVVSGQTGVIDYVQFPRETLSRKSGDCDDLTSLYATALEALGIKTKLIDAPAHIYMIFDTGVEESKLFTLGFPEENFIILDGTVWIPIETTLVGKSFTVAWKQGVTNYKKEKDHLKIIDLQLARTLYKAPNLKKAAFTEKLTKSDIDNAFPGELDNLIKSRTDFLDTKYEAVGSVGLGSLIMVYAKQGLLDKAITTFEKIPKVDYDAVILNNIGNVYLLKDDAISAVKNYGMALSLAPKDTGILVNISRALLKKGSKNAAKKAFAKALEVDPSLKDTYTDLFVKLKK